MIKKSETKNKPTLSELFFQYLSNTPLIMLFLHLIWMIIASSVLSITYVVAFHFTSLVTIYEETHNSKTFNSNLKLTVKQDQDITLLLDKLLKDTSSNRAYIFRYTNELASVSGVPFFFQTNTHEVITPGTSRVLQFEQHMSASTNYKISAQFMANKCGVVYNADADVNSQEYLFYQDRGARSLIRCPIFLKNGDLVGFVGIDYLDTKLKKDLDMYIDTVKTAADELSNMFEKK